MFITTTVEDLSVRSYNPFPDSSMVSITDKWNVLLDDIPDAEERKRIVRTDNWLIGNGLLCLAHKHCTVKSQGKTFNSLVSRNIGSLIFDGFKLRVDSVLKGNAMDYEKSTRRDTIYKKGAMEEATERLMSDYTKILENSIRVNVVVVYEPAEDSEFVEYYPRLLVLSTFVKERDYLKQTIQSALRLHNLSTELYTTDKDFPITFKNDFTLDYEPISDDLFERDKEFDYFASGNSWIRSNNILNLHRVLALLIRGVNIYANDGLAMKSLLNSSKYMKDFLYTIMGDRLSRFLAYYKI